MTITEARLKSGVLTLKAGAGPSATTYQAACQATNVRIVPGTDDNKTDAVEVLCGDIASAASAAKPADTLNVSSIQDFTDPAGFQAFTWAHRGEDVEFTWKPSATSGEWHGKVTISVPIEVGGEVNQRLTADVAWPIVSLTPPTGFGTGYGTSKPDKGAAAPGDVFPAEGTVSASDAQNAAKLAGLGYTAKPSTAWTTGQKITIGGYDFNWTGSAWAAGAHA